MPKAARRIPHLVRTGEYARPSQPEGDVSSIDEAFGIAIQPEARSWRQASLRSPVANNDPGNFAVIHYNPDGSIDTTFGAPGVITKFRTDVPTDEF